MTVTSAPSLGSPELTEYLLAMTNERGQQSAVDLAVLRDQVRRTVDLLNDLSRAMTEVQEELITEGAKDRAAGRASAYTDAAQIVARQLGRL